MNNRFAFIGGTSGPWRVVSNDQVHGDSLGEISHLDVKHAKAELSQSGTWVLYGLASNVRYATRLEVTSLRSKQEPLGRSSALRAALIPIKKSSAWWNMAQDERREIFEEQSHHTAVGLEYLPTVARQLYHCRDIGEPFDFLTWFEYAPEYSNEFERLVHRLRSTKEWSFVEREVDIRLERGD